MDHPGALRFRHHVTQPGLPGKFTSLLASRADTGAETLFQNGRWPRRGVFFGENGVCFFSGHFQDWKKGDVEPVPSNLFDQTMTITKITPS